MKGRDILIVEDETIVALDMRIRLEAMGYRVVGLADSASPALDLVAREHPDLVLMDIKLKGGDDGISVASLIRERAELPIIFVTAFTDERTLERAKLASPYGYIVKPFHERELRIAIELALYKFQYELSIRRAKELAEETNRLKSEFLANMSHELKTPLNSIIGFTELALDRAGDAEQREYLGTALKSAQNLVGLIDAILDFTRLEAGRLTSSPAPFSLDEVLEGCVELLALGAQAKGLEVSYRRASGLPSTVVGDAALIHKILTNLEENATKFTERGGIQLEADVAPPDKASRFELPSGGFVLRLVVEDSGMGMPPERLAEAFEYFFQLDGSRTRPAGGVGLGLSIVKKSVELLGGVISVASEPGKGCRFEVLLPLMAAEPIEASPAKSNGNSLVLVGFPLPELANGISSLEILGLPNIASAPSLAEAVDMVGDSGIVFVDERVLPKELPAARKLGGRLIVGYRFGGRGRSLAAEEGFRAFSLPLRPRAFSQLLAGELPRQASAGGQRRPSPRKEVNTVSPGQVQAPADAGPSRELLARFITALSSSLDPLDYSRIERDAKEYSRLFDEIGGCDYGRLAFSALLLARKGDDPGLQTLLQRAEKILGTGLSEHDTGGAK